jgi:PTH1 family peptidyl-tRNA hydrolase
MKHEGNQAIQLIALLGNPGKQYARTRHNVGWMLAPFLTNEAQSRWKEKFHGRFIKEASQIILMPETFMNHTGRSVQAARSFFGFHPQNVVVVHDDMETPFGTITLTLGGGHRGNNGVRSIATAFGSPEFWRLRIGVGRPPAGRKPGDWILQRFTADEEAVLLDVLELAATILTRNQLDPKEETRHIGG